MWQTMRGATAGLLVAGCAMTAGTYTWRQPAIGAVEIGDSMAQVRAVLGAPKEERVGALLADGHRQMLWVYEAASVSEASISGAVRASVHQPVRVDATQATQPVDATAYVVIFEHGQVVQVIEEYQRGDRGAVPQRQEL